VNVARLWLTVIVLLAAAPQPRLPRVLYLTQSAGFKHEVLPLSEEILPRIGTQAHAFATTVVHDSSAITAETLRNYDAVVFYTTGELPLSGAQKTALLAFVRNGKGFVGNFEAFFQNGGGAKVEFLPNAFTNDFTQCFFGAGAIAHAFVEISDFHPTFELRVTFDRFAQ